MIFLSPFYLYLSLIKAIRLLDDERSYSLIFYVKVREMTKTGREGFVKARRGSTTI